MSRETIKLTVKAFETTANRFEWIEFGFGQVVQLEKPWYLFNACVYCLHEWPNTLSGTNTTTFHPNYLSLRMNFQGNRKGSFRANGYNFSARFLPASTPGQNNQPFFGRTDTI